MTPQPDEYDYLPAPTITSISTSGGPASLASENGGSTITIDGTGFNLVGLDFVAFGDPGLESSDDLTWLTVTGTQIQLVAPGTPTLTTGPSNLPVSVMTAVGLSPPLFAQYAGLPTVTSVVATSGPTAMRTTAQGRPGAPDTGGTSIALGGADFTQATGIVFADTLTSLSVGTQFHFSVANDENLSTQTVAQNPATVDVEVCDSNRVLVEPARRRVRPVSTGRTRRLDGCTGLGARTRGDSRGDLGGQSGVRDGGVVRLTGGQVIRQSIYPSVQSPRPTGLWSDHCGRRHRAAVASGYGASEDRSRDGDDRRKHPDGRQPGDDRYVHL